MSESFTRQPRYDRETWQRAMAAWEAGRFGPEWADWRLLAARTGIVFPPDGTAQDSWSDPRPSQRAMLIRAIRETPRLLRWALTQPGVRSWGDVLEHLLTGRDRLGLDARQREEDWTVEKSAMTRAGDVLATIRDSLGVEDDE